MQVHLFGKGLNSLNAVESMIKHLSNELHIDQTLSEGDIGLQLNANSYEAEIELLGNDDEEESTPSSPSSSQVRFPPLCLYLVYVPPLGNALSFWP